MKDFFGNELAVNDLVAIPRPNYRDVTLAVVVSFTPKRVRVAYNHYTYGGSAYVDSRGKTWGEFYLTDPRDVIKAPDQNKS